MSELPDFLLTRIAEDEDEARSEAAALARRRGIDALIEGGWGAAYANPARVLAECEAKRRIVETHGCDSIGPTWHKCTTCADWDNADYDGPPYIDFPCPTIRALASVYADHPDYRQDWS